MLASTNTGRLASSDPNLQNIPIKSEDGREIRKAFVPEKNNILISADYNQVEMRILADLANVKELKKLLPTTRIFIALQPARFSMFL